MISKLPATLSPSVGKGFDIEEVLQNASLAEKISLLSGLDFWHTTPLPRFNVPSIRLSDGPNGVRGTKFFDAIPAACLPCGSGLAATWDKDLLYLAGELIGKECIAKGAHVWLGPTVNIPRSPLGGRGFESMSEDPYVTGHLAASYIRGCQSQGVISTIKHWLANDQEHERLAVDARIDERALREIHMLPFQIAIEEANPGAVMACYNRVNGLHVSENRDLLDGVLREEWGWKGLIMSDWFGTYSTVEALNAGLDLEMPGPARLRGQLADLTVSSRKVKRTKIDERVRNVLEFVETASRLDVAEEEGVRNLPEDRNLNRKLAASSMVLLKNEKNALPLRRDVKKIALIGPNMKNAAFCGGGSASLTPYYAVSPFDGIVAKLGPDVEIQYEGGPRMPGYLPVLQAPNITTPDGLQGCRLRFYHEPPHVQKREIIDEVVVSEMNWQLMGFSNPKLDRLFFVDIEATLVAPKSAMFEFGLSVYGSGNLYIDDQLIIDNTSIQRGGKFFLGKGTCEEKAVVSLVEGRSYRIKVEFVSSPSSKLVKPGVISLGGGAGRLGMAEVVDDYVAIANAVKAAKENEVTILCVGLNKDFESEGFDRPDMDLPGAIPQLISAVVDANPNTIVITQSGAPFTMLPWAERISTHLHSWYGGNETGNGIADVLFGDVNPSGKLPVSFPRCLEDTPTFLNFGSERGRVVYGESICIGYRYYEKVKRSVLYPFGHGLSYTTFTFSDLVISEHSATLNVSNTGPRSGAEVVQLYIACDPATSSIPRPKKELKGFEKVYLQPGERKEVEIQFDKFTIAFWDEILHKWVCESGTYRVLIGTSSVDIRLEGVLNVEKTWTWSGL